MPRAERKRSGAAGVLVVDGLYEALRECERWHQERADRFGARMSADGMPMMRRPRDLLDALEAGEPVVLAPSQLGGWMLPKVPLTRAQREWGHWYRVSPDDSVTPAEAPR